MAKYERDHDHAGPEARIETLAIHGGQHPEPVDPANEDP